MPLAAYGPLGPPPAGPDSDTLYRAASGCQAAQQALGDLARDLERAGTVQGWSSPAGTLFAISALQVASSLLAAGEDLAEAAQALRTLARDMGAVQEGWSQAEALARIADNPLAGAIHHAGQAQAEEARYAADAACRVAILGLDGASHHLEALAAGHPAPSRGLLGEAGHAGHEFLAGFWDSTKALLTLGIDTGSPLAFFKGKEAVKRMVHDDVEMIAHPSNYARSIAELWREDPARALGMLVLPVGLPAVTDGIAAAADGAEISADLEALTEDFDASVWAKEQQGPLSDEQLLAIAQQASDQLARDLKAHIAKAKRINKLARDPDTGGTITAKSLLETLDALVLEERGAIPGEVRRANPNVARERGADFIDGTGQAWDHKAPRTGTTSIPVFMKKTGYGELHTGIKIILNRSFLSSSDLSTLLTIMRERNWTSDFVFIPPLEAGPDA